MLRKLIGAGLIVAAMTGAAAAQFPMPGVSFGHDEKKKLTPEEQARQDAIDNAYNSTLKKIPEKRATVDPWGNIRDTQTPSKTKPQ